MNRVSEARVRDILAHPFDVDWSIQGFGMLRTYLDDEHVQRLHIWDVSAAVPEVSTIHDHPWDFTSTIVQGEIENRRFGIVAGDGPPIYGGILQAARIRCGEGGGITERLGPVRVATSQSESYGPGDSYSMLAPELHESIPSRGAVTVITRKFHADREVATVCWRDGDWISAEPRAATREEIEHFISIAQGDTA